MNTPVKKISPQVLVVGAGPTGLMMACQLALHKIPFRIIDKNKDSTTQSRALVIQARSLEILDQMGIAGKSVRQGQKAEALGAIFNGKRLLRVTVRDIGEGLTKFPYFLILEQSKTEEILTEFLTLQGNCVEREIELVHFTQDTDGVTATVKNQKGEEEVIKTKYLVGADGAHSVVRHRLNIPFGGKTYQQSLFVLDCKIKQHFPPDEMYLAFSETAVAGIFPLTNGRFRIAGTIPSEFAEKEAITFEDVAKGFAPEMHMNITLQDPQWIATYHSHHRYASTFRKENCFLIGDAAHIHSPVGAQGMNTGLQDAYNLAWKLAFVIQGKAKDTLLDTFTQERITIAKRLVATTDRAFNVVTNQNALMKILRLHIIPFLLQIALPIAEKQKRLRQLAFKTISEIGIEYRSSPLGQNASVGIFPHHAPKPGERVPYVEFDDGKGEKRTIQEKLNGITFTLLHFMRENEQIISEEISAFAERYKEIVAIEVIPSGSKTKKLYKAFGIENGGYYLVRPDMYIACRNPDFNTEFLKQYFERFLVNDSI